MGIDFFLAKTPETVFKFLSSQSRRDAENAEFLSELIFLLIEKLDIKQIFIIKNEIFQTTTLRPLRLRVSARNIKFSYKLCGSARNISEIHGGFHVFLG